MKVLDKMAAAAENYSAPAAAASSGTSGQVTMKLTRPGESVKNMVARRKAAFARDCGT